MVIVGFSYSGFTVGELLWDTFDVTIIDRKNFFDHFALGIYGLVDERLIDYTLYPIETIQAGYGHKFKFVQASLLNVNRDNSIEILQADGTITGMDYDFLILATGFMYELPIRDEKSVTIPDRKNSVRAVRSLIGESKNVLVVGGGVVGVQVAGELAMAFAEKGEKKIDMCIRRNRLLASLPAKAADLADKYLRSHGVTIRYNTPFESLKDTAQYDLVVKCTGYVFKTEYMDKYFSRCLQKNGQV